MGWTDERVEMLKTLWTAGLSASQIADRLGGVTRNAVIGKVHRLKLESRAKPPAGGPTAAAQPAASPQAGPVEAVEIVVPSRVNAPQPAITMARTMPHSSPASHSKGQSHGMPMTMGANALKMEPDDEHLAEEAADPVRQTGEVVPIARKLSLVQLTETTCKWPVGDPLKPDFHFCGNGAKDSSPYCAYHAKLAFQPVSDRRRVR